MTRTMTMNDFELERERRIEANRLRMLEMGIGAMASKIQAPAPVPAPKVRNPRASSPEMRFFPPDCVPEPSGVSLTRSIRAPPRAAPVRSPRNPSHDTVRCRRVRFFRVEIARARANYADGPRARANTRVFPPTDTTA